MKMQTAHDEKQMDNILLYFPVVKPKDPPRYFPVLGLYAYEDNNYSSSFI